MFANKKVLVVILNKLLKVGSYLQTLKVLPLAIMIVNHFVDHINAKYQKLEGVLPVAKIAWVFAIKKVLVIMNFLLEVELVEDLIPDPVLQTQ